MHRVVPANIVVRHTFGGHSETIIPENDGCLGSWNGGGFEIEIEPLTGFDVTQVNENGEIYHPASIERGRRRNFTISIPLFWSEEAGFLSTRFPSNQVRLIGPTDTTRAWNITIVTRETNFFLEVTSFFLRVQGVVE